MKTLLKLFGDFGLALWVLASLLVLGLLWLMTYHLGTVMFATFCVVVALVVDRGVKARKVTRPPRR